jgi:homoserine O-succinyltransferase
MVILEDGPLRHVEPTAFGQTHATEMGCRDEPLVIALVNNMPDAALSATERQFRNLLSAASKGEVRLRVFSIPEINRGKAGLAYIENNCESIENLWAAHIDGLIVTGTEPHETMLTDEPYWPTLARLVDWAEEHTYSGIWSCLAAHAAVLHKDGIERSRRAEKLSGLFHCTKTYVHPILAGTPAGWRVPHSRYNELPEQALASKQYEILLRSHDAGADTFVKRRNSLFIFFQGHPEYDPETLLREYRRDVGRFIAGERNSYPMMPEGYFDKQAMAVLNAFRARVERTRDADALTSFPGAEAARGLTHPWHGPAVCIYRNWLSFLRERSFGLANGKRSIAGPGLRA